MLTLSAFFLGAALGAAISAHRTRRQLRELTAHLQQTIEVIDRETSAYALNAPKEVAR